MAKGPSQGDSPMAAQGECSEGWTGVQGKQRRKARPEEGTAARTCSPCRLGRALEWLQHPVA